jgi:hypothetical protein
MGCVDKLKGTAEQAVNFGGQTKERGKIAKVNSFGVDARRPPSVVSRKESCAPSGLQKFDASNDFPFAPGAAPPAPGDLLSRAGQVEGAATEPPGLERTPDPAADRHGDRERRRFGDQPGLREVRLLASVRR